MKKLLLLLLFFSISFNGNSIEVSEGEDFGEYNLIVPTYKINEDDWSNNLDTNTSSLKTLLLEDADSQEGKFKYSFNKNHSVSEEFKGEFFMKGSVFSDDYDLFDNEYELNLNQNGFEFIIDNKNIVCEISNTFVVSSEDYDEGSRLGYLGYWKSDLIYFQTKGTVDYDPGEGGQFLIPEDCPDLFLAKPLNFEGKEYINESKYYLFATWNNRKSIAKYWGYSKEVCLTLEEEDRYNCKNYFRLPSGFIFFESIK